MVDICRRILWRWTGLHCSECPGLMVGAFAGNRLGAIRDAKGKSVAAVFTQLGGDQKAEELDPELTALHSRKAESWYSLNHPSLNRFRNLSPMTPCRFAWSQDTLAILTQSPTVAPRAHPPKVTGTWFPTPPPSRTARPSSILVDKDHGTETLKPQGLPSSISTLKGSNGRKRHPSPGESTETEVVSLPASASTSSAKSAATQTPKNATKATRTATKKRQRLLIDAAIGEPKSTVASTRDPFDDDEGDVIMSDARDEPFEDDFEIDFQMLRLDEVTTPAWVPAGTSALRCMKRSLDSVEKARRKLEERYLQEMHKRIALENELARLRRCITLGSVGLKTPPPEAL
ncbi:DnaJ-domain-containing protein [Salix suchowensis]|nr:DnaJ-domain-containing protein [Salix suchowensis]